MNICNFPLYFSKFKISYACLLATQLMCPVCIMSVTFGSDIQITTFQKITVLQMTLDRLIPNFYQQIALLTCYIILWVLHSAIVMAYIKTYEFEIRQVEKHHQKLCQNFFNQREGKDNMKLMEDINEEIEFPSDSSEN